MQSTKPAFTEICLAMCLVGVAPLVVLQAIHLWERPHFQFFPLAWLAFGYFIYAEGAIGWSTNLWRQWVGVGIWAVGLTAVVVAAFFFSPWIGQAAAILCISGWGLLRLDAVQMFRWLAWTLLLWITLPMPGNLDAEVVNGLQRLSAQSASQLLDLMGVLHLPQGTTLEIRSRQLFVDEACSGIDSLYSLIAISLLMMVWQRRPLVVGLFTLLTVPMWAWLGNVLRLLLIVVLLDRWQIDLSEGWPHTVLGIATFAVSSVCLLITLGGFAILFERFSGSSMPEERQWHLVYNAIVCFPGKPPTILDETDQYFAVQPVAPAVKEQKVPRFSPWQPPGRNMTVVLSLVCLVALGLNARSTSRDWIDGRSSRLPHYQLSEVDTAFNENDFPETFAKAQRVKYHADQRTPESFYGEYSRSWTFRDPRGDFVLSIDFPFRGYHPLWVCYTNAGNEIQGTPTPILQSSQPATDQPHVVQVKFKDDLDNYSYLWFELFDKDGKPISVKSYDQPEENAIVARLKTVMADTVARDPVSYQLQLYVPSSRELTKQELDEYAKFFEATAPVARQLVKKLPM